MLGDEENSKSQLKRIFNLTGIHEKKGEICLKLEIALPDFGRSTITALFGQGAGQTKFVFSFTPALNDFTPLHISPEILEYGGLRLHPKNSFRPRPLFESVENAEGIAATGRLMASLAQEIEEKEKEIPELLVHLGAMLRLVLPELIVASQGDSTSFEFKIF